MDFYSDNAETELLAFAFDRRKGKRYGIPSYQMEGGRRFVAYIHWSRDCDGVEGERIRCIPASMAALKAFIDHESQWADGPFSVTPVTLQDAVDFEGWSRDRTLAAFENGHPYSI